MCRGWLADASNETTSNYVETMLHKERPKYRSTILFNRKQEMDENGIIFLSYCVSVCVLILFHVSRYLETGQGGRNMCSSIPLCRTIIQCLFYWSILFFFFPIKSANLQIIFWGNKFFRSPIKGWEVGEEEWKWELGEMFGKQLTQHIKACYYLFTPAMVGRKIFSCYKFSLIAWLNCDSLQCSLLPWTKFRLWEAVGTGSGTMGGGK